jgi:tripartite ATP-independent transporter DctM subunit
MGNVSIGRLFLAGIIPGLLMMLFLMFTTWRIARKRGYQPELAERPAAGEVLKALYNSKWALLFPVILVVTIRFGIFTPSEAGAFAVIYALLVGKFAHRELTLEGIRKALNDSVTDIGMIMLIILFSGMVGYIIAFEEVPNNLALSVSTLSSNPTLVILICLLFLLLAGMVMEATVIVLLLTPILVPVVTAVGIDPVHFGILMMIIVTMGGMTPPVGVTMYSVCGILKCPAEVYVKESLPFIGSVLLLVLLMTLLPGIVLFLPELLM